MNSLLRYLISKPQRWRHRRGFGIQSPWAYEFVTDVLFGRQRFYAFDTLKGTSRDEQLFRVCAWLNPQMVHTAGATETTEAYIRSACGHQATNPMRLFYYATSHAIEVRKACNDGLFLAPTCIVLEGINRGDGQEVWQELLNHPSCTTSFDLGRRGIVFFDPSRQKQNYLL